METPVIISLSISIILAIVQVWNFIDHQSSKKEDKLKTYAKEVDVKNNLIDITNAISEKINHINETITSNRDLSVALSSKLERFNTELHVIKERVDNEIRTTSKSLDKLESKLDDIIKEISR